MLIPRILTGHVLLDRFPFWIALPVGVGGGALAGYWVVSPGAAPSRFALALAVLALALLLGLTAPRPVRKDCPPRRQDEPPADELLV